MHPDPEQPRIDWRFLLADPEPARITVLGGSDAWRRSMASALEEHGYPRPTMADSTPSPLDADLVVARRGDGLDVPGLTSSLPETTSLVLEVATAHGAWPRIDRPHTRLFAWPSLARPTELIPARRPDAREFAARRRRARGGWSAAVRMTALRIPWPHAAGRIAIVTRNGAASGLRRLAGEDTAELKADVPWSLITPSFRSSRHVVLLLGEHRVLKVERRPGTGSIDREASVLRAVALRPGARVPEVIAVERYGRHRVLVESRVPGVDLTPARVRGSAAGYAAQFATWLRGLVRPASDLSGKRVADLLHGQGHHAVDLIGASPGADLMARALAAVRELEDARLPDAIEHGDLGDPNLLVDRDGTIGVIDWELGRTDGLPLLDLVFLIAFLAAAEAGANAPSEHASAWERCVVDPSGWGHRLLRVEAARLGIDERTVVNLSILCWVQQVQRMAERVGPDASKFLNEHRYVEILRRTLEAAE